MLIRIGHELTIACAQPTPLVCLLTLRPERMADLVAPERQTTVPAVPVEHYRDGFGNVCRRLIAPAGGVTVRTDALVRDSGLPDPVAKDATEFPVEALPSGTLQFVLGSRYVETDLLAPLAWELFGKTKPGWTRVQTIVDYVHDRIAFNYKAARATRTAREAHDEKTGVCRDFAHLALGFLRAMNIPARYVNGYLGDIGVPPDPAPMDFSAWIEVFLNDGGKGRWFAFDARHNRPRIGRIVIAHGRDAADVPLINSFGAHKLTGFKVWTDEVKEGAAEAA